MSIIKADAPLTYVHALARHKQRQPKENERILLAYDLELMAADFVALIERESALRATAREFLDASDAAAKPMDSKKIVGAMTRWARAGAKLRALTGSVVLAGARTN